ncbi:hypothetical protein NCAS_0D00680 [Naumovozyma castellii]|uniref:Tag1 N-terminal domain-containing protein n=1 Tax=Naumovozyma castellii TaxID=27288 RepID=G0VEV4_NAUCA|nr:hypothetical protein NCAS_0D00680 [Naumovozyma castellii CBS 4309]CCC69649.1 hypothetical protein NCAS_0D00680 [Naumovozyma castellii CBS 4309]
MSHEKQPLLPHSIYRIETPKNTHGWKYKTLRTLVWLSLFFLLSFQTLRLSTNIYFSNQTFTVVSIYPSGLTNEHKDIKFTCKIELKQESIYDDSFNMEKVTTFLNENIVKGVDIGIRNAVILNVAEDSKERNATVLGNVSIEKLISVSLEPKGDSQLLTIHGTIEPKMDNIWDIIKNFKNYDIWLKGDLDVFRPTAIWNIPFFKSSKVHIKL